MELREAWGRLRRGRPSIDVREAALGLGVTEVELVASTCGDGAVRLVPQWDALAASLPELGGVVASTGNARASLRQRGVLPGAPGRVTVLPVAPIDVRVAPGASLSVFAVREEGRREIRLFDAAGARVHAIALAGDARAAAFEALVARQASADQSPREIVRPLGAPPPPAPAAAGVVRARWDALGGPDDVAALCVALGLTRQEGLRAAPPEWVWPVARQCVRQVLAGVAADAIPVTVTVGNRAVRQSRTGLLARPEERGHALVVRTRDFAFHLRADRVGSAWVVCTPGGRMRIPPALELLDEAGSPLARIAAAEDRREQDLQRWAAALRRLPVAPRG